MHHIKHRSKFLKAIEKPSEFTNIKWIFGVMELGVITFHIFPVYHCYRKYLWPIFWSFISYIFILHYYTHLSPLEHHKKLLFSTKNIHHTLRPSWIMNYKDWPILWRSCYCLKMNEKGENNFFSSEMLIILNTLRKN